MKCCDKEVVTLSGVHHVKDAWGFNVCACQICGNVFRMNAWPNKEVWSLSMDGTATKVDLKKMAKEEYDKTRGPMVTVPSGLEVEMLPEVFYVRKYQEGGSMSKPTPNNIGGWAMFVLKDRSVFDSLTDEDKLFLHDQQFEVYKVWKK